MNNLWRDNDVNIGCKVKGVPTPFENNARQSSLAPSKFVRIFGLTCLIISITTSLHAEQLKASWYSRDSLIKEGTWKHGETPMANGKRFDETKLTCACRLYRLGTVLLITNLSNGKAVRVTVTDRIGKRFAQTRIDLSRAAFERIANLKAGVVPIKAEVLND